MVTLNYLEQFKDYLTINQMHSSYYHSKINLIMFILLVHLSAQIIYYDQVFKSLGFYFTWFEYLPINFNQT